MAAEHLLTETLRDVAAALDEIAAALDDPDRVAAFDAILDRTGLYS